MDRARKETVINELNSIFEDSGVIVVAHYSGMTVSNMSDLRNRMRSSLGSVRVAKNRLSKIALKGKRNEEISKFFVGQTVLLYSEDPVAAAKIAVAYSKDDENLKILGGSLGDKILDASGVIDVSKMPSREELLSQITSCVGSPGSFLSQILASPGSNIGGIINAIEEKSAA
jgi:large subunit ribosomal protein L10